jgi:hypothetical protein
MIIDDEILVTGSYEWTKTSEDQNDENIIILRSKYIAELYLAEFERIWAQTHPYQPDPVSPEGGVVVINEVESNPEGVDAGNEWVELYNPSEKAVDISEWMLSKSGEMTGFIIPVGTVLEPNTFYVYVIPEEWILDKNEQLVLYNEMHQEQDKTLIFNDLDDDSKSWQRSPDGYDSDKNTDWVFYTSSEGTIRGFKPTG